MKKFVSSLLLSGLIGLPSAFANGLVLSDGTYYNEPGQSTIFNNATSITIPTGVTIRGLEVIIILNDNTTGSYLP